MTIIDQAVHDIIIHAGAKWDLDLEYQNDDGSPVDLTGWTPFCQIRSRAGGEILAEPTIVVTAGLGKIALSLLPAITEAIGSDDGEWDVLIGEDADHTNIVYLVGGQAQVKHVITVVEWPPP